MPARPHGKKDPLKILIGTDGSACATAAVQAATRLLEPSAAELIVVSVAREPITASEAYSYPMMPMDAQLCQQLHDEAQAAAEDNLAQARRVLELAGVKAEYMVRWGEPAEELLRLADEIKPDLLVLGSHGRSALGRLFLGSVSEAVLHRWPGASLIVRTPPARAMRTAPGSPGPEVRTVRMAMTPAPVCVSQTTTLQDAARRMQEADTGLLPVLDGTRLVGVITDRDLVVRAIALGVDPRTATVGEFQSRHVCTIGPDATCDEAVKQMEKHGIRRLLVADAGRLLGVLSLGDLAECVPDAAEEVLVEISKSPKTLAHGGPWMPVPPESRH